MVDEGGRGKGVVGQGLAGWMVRRGERGGSGDEDGEAGCRRGESPVMLKAEDRETNCVGEEDCVAKGGSECGEAGYRAGKSRA